MRFELFDGPRSLGTVAWERPGQVRLEIRDPKELDFLVEYFGGEPRAEESDGPPGQVVVPRQGWTRGEFERACLDLREVRSYLVVPRPLSVNGEV